MGTEWQYRINVLIPIEEAAMMNALWTLVGPEGDHEATSFGVPLSPTGLGPATMLGISTAATAVMRAYIEDTFAEELAGAIVSFQDCTENDWEELLAAHGLQVIVPPMEV